MTSGSVSCTVPISHSQNANGLVCGLSTRKTRTPRRSRSARRRARGPQPSPVRAVEVERVDVLVALGRVLGVRDRAVRAVAEPLGMLPNPRMVGRRLEREVERDLDAVARAASTRCSTSAIVPRSGWTAVWPPSTAPIAHGLPRILGARRRSRCCGPCGASCRSGGSAGGRRRRNPSPRCTAAASRRRRGSRARSGRVTWNGGTARTRPSTVRAGDRPKRPTSCRTW